jgi:ferredoxin-NADP reductase
MYRLTMYILLIYVVLAAIFSLFGWMPFEFWDLVISWGILLIVCYVANKVFSWIFRVPANTESFYITWLILTLVIQPATDKSGFLFLVWAGLIAIGSKYVLAINRKHIFNPAALAVVTTFYLIGQGASWWVGNMYMQIPLIIGGILIVRKIRRWNMVYTFLIVNLGAIALYNYLYGSDVWLAVKYTLMYSQIFFFATVMFTEPATTPPTNRLQILYGAVVGVLASPFMVFGNFYFTPELALVAGNVFSFLVSPKWKTILTLMEKKKIGADMYEFAFRPNRKINFQPGQYLEWTLGHSKSDLRGNRRYFTIASSPTEENIKLGVKFYPEPSSFKKALLDLPTDTKLVAGQLAGDFTLPKDVNQKLVFIAGGIGITPYRSMFKYMIDRDEKRPITLFFSNRTQDEIVYQDILDEAETKLRIKTVYTLTGNGSNGWKGGNGEMGRVDEKMIAKYVPDYKNAIFYISGNHAMVSSMQELLNSMGIPRRQIKIDFFPGFV